MDGGGRHENERHQMDYYRGSHTPWNMVPQHQGNEQNALAMNRKIMSIIAEKDAAIHERNLALTEKKEALAARDAALVQREKAHAERDQALMERDNALAALQYRESSINFTLGSGIQRGIIKRLHLPPTRVADMDDIMREGHTVDAFPLSAISSEPAKSRKRKRPKESKAALSKTPKPPLKVKKIGEDLNKQLPSDGKKYKSEWESHDVGLNLIAFDEATMPGPVCSCTGVPRQCYKWGNGGWQSSCCTTTMSEYPLPQRPNKRHARVGGRKMSGSVFTRLLSRLAAGGHDPSLPLDLKDYWARHGTNRYITIK